MSDKAAALQEEIRKFLTRYREDSVAFAEEVLKVTLDKWQTDALRAYDRRERRIAIASAHGPGKTFVLSIMGLHQILFRYPQKAVFTAPTSSQLFDALMAEIKSLAKRLPAFAQDWIEVKSDRIVLKADPDGSFISARTSRAETPEALQGVHSANVLLGVDEASGVPEPIFEASIGSMSGENATTVLMSNPTRSSGFFYDVFHRLEGWFRISVGADDPDFRDGEHRYRSPRVSKAYIKDVEDRYGRESNAFRVRVLAEFPRADLDAQIPYELVDSAMRRDVKGTDAPVIWGLDVARFGDAETALARRKGNCQLGPVVARRELDTMQIVGWLKNEIEVAQPWEKPSEVLVDVIGLGAGVVDRARELGLPVRGVNVAEASSMKAEYSNLRSELWDECRKWLSMKDCKLDPNDDALASQLTGVKYGFTSAGKRKVESKDEMRKRGVPSPDRADAWILTFASAGATAAGAGGGEFSWNKPIVLNRKGIV